MKRVNTVIGSTIHCQNGRHIICFGCLKNLLHAWYLHWHLFFEVSLFGSWLVTLRKCSSLKFPSFSPPPPHIRTVIIVIIGVKGHGVAEHFLGPPNQEVNPHHHTTKGLIEALAAKVFLHVARQTWLYGAGWHGESLSAWPVGCKGACYGARGEQGVYTRPGGVRLSLWNQSFVLIGTQVQ